MLSALTSPRKSHSRREYDIVCLLLISISEIDLVKMARGRELASRNGKLPEVGHAQ